MQIDDPWRFNRPELAAHYLQLLKDAPRRPLAVFGPRQTGKTYLLTHDLSEAARNAGLRAIYVDLWTQGDPLGAINSALTQRLREMTLQTGRTAVTSLGAAGFSVGLAAPAPLPPVADPSAWMSLQFAEIRRLDAKQPILLMLDEAQTLGKGHAGDAAMKAVRGLFNAHPGELLLLLTGSSKSQLLALVGDHSKTAFKLAAHMDFPTLGSAFVSFVAVRYKAATGRDVEAAELDGAFAQLQHRPGEMIDFIRFWIADRPDLALGAALDKFKLQTRPVQQIERQYAECTPIQRALLKAVARGERLFSVQARRDIALQAGLNGSVQPGTLSSAMSTLESRGLVIRQGRGVYRLADEHLGEWLATGTP